MSIGKGGSYGGYDLGLISDPGREPRKLYIECTAEKLNYEVIGLDNYFKKGTIPWNKLKESPLDVSEIIKLINKLKKFPLDASEMIKLKNQLLPKLLELTSIEGHTRSDSEQKSLFSLVQSGETDEVRKFLERGDNPNATRASYSPDCDFTPLYLLLETRSLEHQDVITRTKLLLEFKTNPNVIRETTGFAPLHLIFTNDYLKPHTVTELTKLLLESKADSNLKTKKPYFGLTYKQSFEDPRACLNFTALHLSAETGNLQSMLLLLKQGADIFCKTQDGKSILELMGDKLHRVSVKEIIRYFDLDTAVIEKLHTNFKEAVTSRYETRRFPPGSPECLAAIAKAEKDNFSHSSSIGRGDWADQAMALDSAFHHGIHRNKLETGGLDESVRIEAKGVSEDHKNTVNRILKQMKETFLSKMATLSAEVEKESQYDTAPHPASRFPFFLTPAVLRDKNLNNIHPASILIPLPTLKS